MVVIRRIFDEEFETRVVFGELLQSLAKPASPSYAAAGTLYRARDQSPWPDLTKYN